MSLWVFVIVLCAVIGWFMVWSAKVDDLDRLRQEEIALKDEYKNKLQQAVNLDELRKQKEQVSQYVLTLEKQLPSRRKWTHCFQTSIRRASAAACSSNCFVRARPTSRTTTRSCDCRQVSGRYHDLGAFTSDIANLPRIVTLNNLALAAGKDGSLTLDATAKTFAISMNPSPGATQGARDKAKK